MKIDWKKENLICRKQETFIEAFLAGISFAVLVVCMIGILYIIGG